MSSAHPVSEPQANRLLMKEHGGTAETLQTDCNKKTAFKANYQDSYLSYGFITTGDTQAPYLLCIICGERPAKQVMEPSKVLCHVQTKHPVFKVKPLHLKKNRKRKKNINLKDKSTY